VKRLKTRALPLGLFVVALCAAFAGALEPRFPFGLADYDWAFHLIAFSFLTVAGSWIGWPLWLLVLLIGFAGVSIELAQAALPNTNSVRARYRYEHHGHCSRANFDLWRAVFNPAEPTGWSEPVVIHLGPSTAAGGIRWRALASRKCCAINSRAI
jgi:hypothetical protein